MQRIECLIWLQEWGNAPPLINVVQSPRARMQCFYDERSLHAVGDVRISCEADLCSTFILDAL